MTTIETTSGRLSGIRQDATQAFLGIPYAAPPTGALRFQSPKPPRTWRGVREATAFGPSAIQMIDPMVSWIYTLPEAMSEDCLSLNVWAPAGASNRPVVVWIHGGGFRTGSSAMPLFDGQHFAAQAGVVLVSINHRNSTLGWLSHPRFVDPDTGATANWGLQDQVQALRWVRDDIAAFGGDPGRVTVMGQSGGAINAIMIAQDPLTRSLLHQLILLSPPFIAPPGFANTADAAALTEDLAHGLGTTVAGLRDVAPADLQMAEIMQWRSGRVQGATGRFLRGPVVDGVSLSQWPAGLDLPAVPTLLGYTRTEGGFWTDLVDPDGQRLTPEPVTGAGEREACIQFLNRIFDSPSAAVISGIADAYLAAYAGNAQDAPSGVMAELIGDALLRQYGLGAAARAAAKGARALRVFDYALPVQPPGRGSPHCCELPVVFGTFDQPHYRRKIGDDDQVRALSSAMMRAFGAFAERGDPNIEDLPAWPEFAPEGETTLVFGAGGELATIARMPKADLLAQFAGLGPQPAD